MFYVKLLYWRGNQQFSNRKIPKNSAQECISDDIALTTYWMPIQQKLTPPEILFSVFAGWDMVRTLTVFLLIFLFFFRQLSVSFHCVHVYDENKTRKYTIELAVISVCDFKS